MSLLRNSRKTECGAERFLTRLAAGAAPFALQGNSRKTECGAERFLTRLAVSAAPFALQGNSLKAECGAERFLPPLATLAALLMLAPGALTAQVARRDHAVPLKNWATPLYWQPNQAERETAAGRTAAAQLQVFANAVSPDALTFVAITPCRLVDTRGAAAGFNGMSPFTGPSIAAEGTITIPVQSTAEAGSNTAPAPCGVIPSIAEAYSLNLTVVPWSGGAVDYVSLWPSGSTQPFVATLDDPQGAIVSNAAIIAAGAPFGGINIYNSGPASTDVIIDMNGYFAAPSDASSNTAVGAGTLANNTTGSGNTAEGVNALGNNATGSNNTASGVGALQQNTTGNDNTASGVNALDGNTIGNNNTATGYQALLKNTAGADNTASGFAALQSNTIGSLNTGIGAQALFANTTGNFNTASGLDALQVNTTGNYNTAAGADALDFNLTGSNNIAIGFDAASGVAGGNSNNIHIGSPGLSGDGSVIRIGTAGAQTSTYIAGIYGGSPGAPNFLVCVDGNGNLGTSGCSNTPSSRRFKEQIADMGDGSSKLLQLRPVTFLYKPQYDDGSHSLQYGLVAEEVAKIYPEMVGFDKDGQPSSVKYQELPPMLLNEVQKQNAQLQKQDRQIREQAEAIQLQQEQNRKLEDRLAALEALISGEPSTAQRPASIP
jgi:hypothetical protein